MRRRHLLLITLFLYLCVTFDLFFARSPFAPFVRIVLNGDALNSDQRNSDDDDGDNDSTNSKKNLLIRVRGVVSLCVLLWRRRPENVNNFYDHKSNVTDILKSRVI